MAAVSSKSMERAADFSRRNNVQKAYDDYEEMLQKERPDCVYIATTRLNKKRFPIFIF